MYTYMHIIPKYCLYTHYLLLQITVVCTLHVYFTTYTYPKHSRNWITT